MSKGRSEVLLENHRVRVVELRLDPGESEPMHSHPDYLVYVLNPATMRMTAADGSSKIVELSAGDLSFGPPTTHAGENVGRTTLHEIIIELKA